MASMYEARVGRECWIGIHDVSVSADEYDSVCLGVRLVPPYAKEAQVLCKVLVCRVTEGYDSTNGLKLLW